MSQREMKTVTKIIRVYGIVQGVGFRPFVSRIADRIGVAGSVANKGSYVEIFVNGTDAQQREFREALETEAPERSAILKIDVHDSEPISFLRFEIIESERESGDIFVSPDIATCPKCKAELYDPNNRRYMHPFINCTACGPRLTILDAMPYDRERTSMGEFLMCPECEYEYTHAETRRYDAQPVCCNDCGPEMYLLEADKCEGEAIANPDIPARFMKPGRNARGREAITFARRALVEGKIIAVKGIGGFHLCCDATNEAAVARLRKLKHRPAKPFAVMMRDMDAVKKYCEVTPEQEEVLDGHQKPIILLRKREAAFAGNLSAPTAADATEPVPNCVLEKESKKNAAQLDGEWNRREKDIFVGNSGNWLAPSVAPDNPKVGVMLPYAPIQMLLFDYNDDVEMTTDCFVMTSGNVSGAPICRTDEDAEKELSGFCDVILSHNRKIRLRADDSVMDFYEGKPYMIRRSRGYAPLPLMKDELLRGQVLAVGGELKNTFCIGKNQLFYPSPYVGDMADPRTVAALSESIQRMEELLETKPELVVCDLHPLYNTTLVAEAQGIPVMKIQHHYAHILSCMAENDVSIGEKVIGVSFDGTGYGTDGTIWGGEIMLSDYQSFSRLGSIRPFLQIGGDASAREGWRIAVSMINALYGEDATEIVKQLGLCEPQMQKLYETMARRGINSVVSTSAGRLFDAASAILGVRRESTFEGEASTTLQFRAEAYEERLRREGRDAEEEIERWLEQAGMLDGMLTPVAAGQIVDSFDYLDGHFAVSGTKERPDGLSWNVDLEESVGKFKKSGREFVLPADHLIRFMAEQKLAGEDVCKLAYAFHKLLANQIVSGCISASKRTGVKKCALSGGVFQNQLLLNLCDKSLSENGFTVYRHSLIPPNDGGIALGQAVYGMVKLMER